MARDDVTGPYDQRTLNYIFSEAPSIEYAAAMLRISPTALAGALAEELHDQFNASFRVQLGNDTLNYWAQSGYATHDQIATGYLSYQVNRDHYELGELSLLETYTSKLTNPTLRDLGPFN